MKFSSTLSKLAAFASLTAGVSATFDASSNKNVAVYWGQASAGSQEDLSYYCSSDNVDIIILSFVTSFDDPPTLNFAAACSDTFSDGLLKCDQIASDIQTCQDAGKKVLLSLGGASGSYGFSSDSDSETFATTLWNLFGEGSSDERPFGESVIDGFDFDIENSDQTGYVALATKLRENFASGSKTYYLSAAPQCVYPDASLSDLLTGVDIDFAFIQFYNNYCNVDKQFNWDTWTEYAASASPNANIKLYLGLPGSSSAAGSGYIDIDTVESTLATIGSDSAFGGVMLWDASQGFSNTVDGETYVAAIKDALNSLSSSTTTTTSAVVSSTSTSSTSTTSTSSSSSTSVTSISSTSTLSSSSSSSTASSLTTSSLTTSSLTTSSLTTNTSTTSSTSSTTSSSTTSSTQSTAQSTRSPSVSTSSVSTSVIAGATSAVSSSQSTLAQQPSSIESSPARQSSGAQPTQANTSVEVTTTTKSGIVVVTTVVYKDASISTSAPAVSTQTTSVLAVKPSTTTISRSLSSVSTSGTAETITQATQPRASTPSASTSISSTSASTTTLASTSTSSYTTASPLIPTPSAFLEVTTNTFSIVRSSFTTVIVTAPASASSSTTTVSTSISSSSIAASSSLVPSDNSSSGCSDLSGQDKADCLNAQYKAGQFSSSPDTCTDGEISCAADGSFAICNYGAWVVMNCAAGTTCYAYTESDEVFVGCNYSSNVKRSIFSHGHHDH